MRNMFIHDIGLLQCLSIFSIFYSYVKATDYTIIEVDIPSVSSYGLRNGPLRRPWSKSESKGNNKPQTNIDRPELCYLPPHIGFCPGRKKRYHYNPETNTCKPFKYSGCLGNANNFATHAKCKDVCKSGDTDNSGKRIKRWRIFCQLPLGKGVCYGNIKSLWKSERDSSIINWSINHLPMEIHLPGYNYCGPGTKSDTKESINQLDEYCREHDMAYQQSKDLRDRHKADIILIRMARSRITAPDSGVGERIAAQIINKAMSKKVKYGALAGNKEMFNPRYEKRTYQIRTSHGRIESDSNFERTQDH